MVALPAMAQPWREPEELVTLPRTVVVVPESREFSESLRTVIKGFGCQVAIGTPISGVMQMVVPRGQEAFFTEVMRMMPGVRWAGPEVLGRGGLSGCNSTGGVMTEPFDYPGPDEGNDADFDLQWYLENTGQTIVNGTCPNTSGPFSDPLNTVPGTTGIDINIRNAWSITQGCEDVVVAVFDTGIQYEHPAFNYDRFFFPDLAMTCPTDNPEDPYECCPLYPADDCDFGFAIDTGAHGTPVAGVVGAQGNNQNQTSGWPEIAGVDLNCRLLSVRVTVANAHGGQSYPLFGAVATLAGLEMILDSSVYADVRVINMSYTNGCSGFPSDPIWGLTYDAIDALKEQGVITVVISSNFGLGEADVRCPAKWDNVITVAGVDNTGARWSDCQGSSGTGNSVDVAAPARALFTSHCDSSIGWANDPPPGTPPESPCGNAVPPQWSSGTSGAAPQVAGVVALLAARADELGVPWSFELCRDLLTHTARPMPPTNPLSTPNATFGYGLVDAYEALRKLEIDYYRPLHRADLTDHFLEDEWRFGVADGVVDCDDLEYFEYAFLEEILEKADFTTGAISGQPGYGVPNGVVDAADYTYYTEVLFPAAYSGSCN